MRTSPVVACMALLLCLSAHPAVAQRSKQRGEVDKILREADGLYRRLQYQEAEKLYRQAIKLDPGNYYVMLRIADLNYETKPQEAANWYQSALDLEPTQRDTTWFDLGQSLKRSGQYVESTRAFERFLELHKRNDFYVKQARVEIEGNRYAELETRRPPGYELRRATPLAGPNTDFDPTIFTQGNQRFVIVTSSRKGSLGKATYSRFGAKEPYSDLWVARMTSDSTYSSPENMGKLINTKANDGSAAVTPDGTELYYSIANNGKPPREGTQNYGQSIYRSRFDADKKRWGGREVAEGVNGTVEVAVDTRGKTKNKPAYDAQPAFSPDGNTMYFVSDRPGGVGGLDIWYSTRAGNTWSPPQNAGRTINTEFDEIQPYVGEDGQTLYFASNGHKGMGGYDLFRSMGMLSNWSEPVNLGYPLNSSGDETAIVWTIQDSTGLVSTVREGSARSDVYWVRRLRRVEQEITITIQGRVRDVKTKQSIPFATVQLYETDGTNLTPLDTFRTDQTGQYKFTLTREKDYKLVGNAPEYLANEVFVSTKNIFETTQLEADIDIFLERIEVSRPIVLQNIYYDFDKADLRPESMAELDRIIALMQENPGVTIQIGAHTDTNGPERYNVGLSQRRARSVVDYLTGKGIARNRINSFGYGESQPLVYPEMSDQDEQTNRRSEFRILTFDLPAGR